VKSYRERAVGAMEAAGVSPPEVNKQQTVPALCNPKQTTENKSVSFPLGDMIVSRIVEAWRNMTGLKGQEGWHPDWDYPPSNPTKINKMTSKPSVNMADYGFPPNDFVCAKALKAESVLGEKNTPASIQLNRLEEWENSITSCLGMINMIDVFSSSLNKDLQAVWDCLGSYKENTLPPELLNLLEERHRIKADAESRAKALQHLTSTLAWLLGETVLLRRDHLLSSTTLSDGSRDVLRMQPLGGPFLFGGRVNEMMHRDSERKTAEMVLKIDNHLFKKKDNPASSTGVRKSSPKPSTSTGKTKTSEDQQQPFRSYRRNNFQKKENNKPSSRRGGKAGGK